MNTFNDRATYLAARLAWKAAYANLSQEIRDTKADIKESYKSGKYDRAGYSQAEKARLRIQAREMLEELAEAKVEAQRQYVAERHAKAA